MKRQSPTESPAEEQPLGAEYPSYLQILKNVFARSGPSEDGKLTFTYEEICYLASDPDFNRIYPDQAVQIRSIRKNRFGKYTVNIQYPAAHHRVHLLCKIRASLD